jgi:hypothetical protein
MGKKVLMVGWHPGTVNHAKYPGLTPEKLEASPRADEARSGYPNLATKHGLRSYEVRTRQRRMSPAC